MYVRSPVPHMLISLSPSYAYENAQKYWATAEKTHREVSKRSFDIFYKRIAEVIKPNSRDNILDAGCGSGEITNAFHEDGFDVIGFDASKKLVERARETFMRDIFYVDDFIEMTRKDIKYSKIFVNCAFFYVHPKQYHRVLNNFFDVLADDGKLFLLDNPDFAKRAVIYKNKMKKIFTTFFPIYDANNSGFWVKKRDVENNALKIGYSKIETVDSWADYRSNMILHK